ncbi:hypothetical protein GCM10020221_36590 [Streptomyces thioluteus]|uniref:4-hydroxybenzoate octaprenyltransferase n=1 Tax=Streptomyces thioluteus TaxID=66431 RepID=A0ABN3X6U0_STRTU
MSASAAAAPSPGRTRAFLRLVMIEHSVFALPFAYIASLTAMFQKDGRIDWWKLLLVTVAMVGLRTFAMACNRIIDREIDARNPRTATANWSPARSRCARRGPVPWWRWSSSWARRGC